VYSATSFGEKESGGINYKTDPTAPELGSRIRGVGATKRCTEVISSMVKLQNCYTVYEGTPNISERPIQLSLQK